MLQPSDPQPKLLKDPPVCRDQIGHHPEQGDVEPDDDEHTSNHDRLNVTRGLLGVSLSVIWPDGEETNYGAVTTNRRVTVSRE